MQKLSTSDDHGPAWLVQAADIARQFFLEGRSKVDIGEDLGLSRFKVARILDEARELGMVQLSIRLPALIDGDASAALRTRLGVRRAVVLAPDTPQRQVREDLGRLAAGLLDELARPGDVIGMSCSRTVSATSSALLRLPACDVVQLTGTLAGLLSDSGSVESVRRAAEVSGGRAWPIYAPLLAPDAATARALSKQEPIRETLARASSVTIALVSIGAWREDLSTVFSAATQRELATAHRARAVGEIGGRLFDEQGTPLDSGIDRRVLGVRLEQLREVREVVALAYGERRAEAIASAARAGLFHTLVCDHGLATNLLDLESRREVAS